MLKADFSKMRVLSAADVRDLGFKDQREFYRYVILTYKTMEEATKMLRNPTEVFFLNRYKNSSSEHRHLVEKEMLEGYIGFQKDLLENYDKIYTMNPEFDDFIDSISNAPSVCPHWSEQD